jgi:ABC-type branched-subunit amino acid transport system ATPase component
MGLLKITGMGKYYGGLKAVDDLDFEIAPGEILGLIGPNGAGKSTTLNMIDGSLSMTKGKIVFKERDISRLPSYKRACLGIARVFQRDVLFSSLSVLENVMVGLHLQSQLGFLEVILPWSARTRRRERQMKTKAMALLSFVGLAHQADVPAVTLPHGSQRVLAMAIAMATNPNLYLLDEPLTGMNSEETEFMMDTISKLRDKEGSSIVVVEHNMKAVMGLCDRAVVLDYGKKIAEGKPGDVVKNERVIEAYLGKEQHVVTD